MELVLLRPVEEVCGGAVGAALRGGGGEFDGCDFVVL